MANEFPSSDFQVPLQPVTRLFREVMDHNAEYAQEVSSKLDVNPTDFDAMGHLMSRGAMTAGELAKAVGISPGAATVMIDRLVAVGHAKREPNPRDRRGVIIAPNPKSVAKAWKLLSPLIEASEQALSEMTAAQRKAVETYLNAMLAAYSEPNKG
jgi:DNA-binding MarR family transcriptional regulator